MKPGPLNLITDVAGLQVGNAQDKYLKSGVSVLLPNTPVAAACHVMGGAPGTRETDLLAPDKTVQQIDALFLSGGSAFGLDTGSGVMDFLRQQGRGFAVGDVRVPIVPGAILFDLLNGGNKNWQENPYRQLGLDACQMADKDFALGSNGAGTGATSADGAGGLGSASLTLDNGVTIGALVAANPLGSLRYGTGPHFRAAPYEIAGEFGNYGLPDQFDPLECRTKSFGPRAGTNTTLAIVATDALLTKAELKRLAIAAHDGFARAIHPAHTPFDGDIVFAVSTAARTLSDAATEQMKLGHFASLTLARAIARGVFEAERHQPA